jgi:addiction module HigA family antidote
VAQSKSPSSTVTNDRPPLEPTHPGEMLLEEFLRPTGETQVAFAARIGWTTARLNEVIRAKRGVTAEAALDLAAVLGTSPELWLNLQMMWDLQAARRRRNRRK